MRLIGLYIVLCLVIHACTTGKNDAGGSPGPQVPEHSNESNSQVIIEESLDPESLLIALQEGDRSFDFYARFTEPFWTIYLVGDVVLFQNMEEPVKTYIAKEKFDPEAEKQVIHFADEETSWELIIEHKTGSDGMSELRYPYTVILNNTYHGGGGIEIIRESR